MAPSSTRRAVDGGQADQDERGECRKRACHVKHSLKTPDKTWLLVRSRAFVASRKEARKSARLQDAGDYH